jgi:hypothetical protein
MRLVGFEPAIPASERPQTHALDRVAAGIVKVTSLIPIKFIVDSLNDIFSTICNSVLAGTRAC